MNAQNHNSREYEKITFEESLKFDVKTMEEYKYSPFNQSTSLFIDANKLIVFPNLNDGNCLIISKSLYDGMFENNSFPVLAENDTPYYSQRSLMNAEGFTKENMVRILDELGLKYDEKSFYSDAEKLAKTLSVDGKMKLFIPMLYFIGEDLHRICPKANWNFSPVYYFQPFNEPRLYYKDNSYSFYDLNVLLEEKLLNGKSITFKNIFKKVEGYYLKEKSIWDLH
jgi:hypothetical protein